MVKECDFFLSLAGFKKVKIPNKLKAAAEEARKRFLDSRDKRKLDNDKVDHSGKRARCSTSKNENDSDIYMAALNKEDDSLYDFWNIFGEE